MSRLIVKGLPKYLTEDKLKEHFAKQGDVTDVKLMKNKFGESRRFAFIGYRGLEEAEKLVKFFNNSFIDTLRIDVELAKTFADPNVPLSWRQKRKLQEDLLKEKSLRLEAEEERLNAKKHNKKQKISELVDQEMSSDPKLKEFMEVMKPSHEVKSWNNDAIVDGSGAPSNKDLEIALLKQDGTYVGEETTLSVTQPVIVAAEAESDDEYEDFKKPGSEAEEEEMMIPLSEAPLEQTNTDGMSDLDWLKHRQVRIKDGEKVESNTEPQTQEENAKVIEKEEPKIEETEEERAINQISSTGRLFIRNISYSSSEDDFRQLFGKYGGLEEVHIAIDTRTGTSKGFLYVQYQNPKDAVDAFMALDKEIFQGRLLHILPGQAKKSHRLDEFDLKNLPLKKQRELKKKLELSKSVFSWNSLFMNNDAVMESVAANLGVSKSDLIDPENSSSAVKQLLAEASVIGDVRKFFESKGVDLTSFDKKEKDDRVILVKNFPYGTTVDEIGELFVPFGELNRLLMPPAGTIAIVEFRDVPSGRSAFTKLLFRRFKKSIIYLEKGPKDLFTREATEDERLGKTSSEPEAKEAKVTSNDLLEEEAVEEYAGPTVSIFVKNLSFSSSKEDLASMFKPLDGFVVATIKTKPDLKNPGSTLSMGFGFVEFKTKEQADTAIRTLDGQVLDGHKLQLKLSSRNASSASTKTPKSTKSSKIIIKNLPFEATRKDIVELFSSFGQLKSVRVPKKFDKSARGFAFVEFALLKEAEQAMDQLTGVHLLGRRLVMQYAQQESADVDEEIEKMTEKVRRQVDTTKYATLSKLTGKRKLNMDEDEADEPF